MKKFIRITSLVLVFCLSGVVAAQVAHGAGDDPLLKAVKARQAEMTLRSFNAGPLFGMAKGDIEYDAEMAATLANNLLIMTTVKNGRMWPGGSDNEAYPDDTRALPEIWTTFPDIEDKGKAFLDAVAALAEVAGTGLGELRSVIGDVGQSCKGCHDDFRAEDD